VDPGAFRRGLAVLQARYRVLQAIDPDGPRHPTLPYLMGEDHRRAEQLNRALSDPEVEAIFCARGGYGTMRILDLVDGEALVRRRVPIVGFSDCTALHLLACRLGVPSIHGPVVTQLARLSEEDRQALHDLLAGSLPRLEGLDGLAGGRARGRLVGGNLTLLAHLAGTRFLPDLHGAVLLLEEVKEAPYRVDRGLTQLALAGVLEQVAGIVVGSLEGCDAPQGVPPKSVRAADVVAERLSGLGVPVATGAPVGHGDRNRALPLGLEAELDADAGTLRFIERS
jgi:muramoyltetrapeptide carboxypeptidase